MNDERKTSPTNHRRDDLVARLDAGEFDDAFEITMAPHALIAAFRLAAYTARADHDPATHFDEFIEALWRQFNNMFDLRQHGGE